MTSSDSRFYKASESLRHRLKNPLGDLIPDSEVSKTLLQNSIFDQKNGISLIASVGDRTTERLHDFGFVPDLEIIDHLEKRIPRVSSSLSTSSGNLRVLSAVNPRGGIDSRALDAIRQSFRLLESDERKSIRIIIDGEEDLLVLPIVVLCKGRSIVMYGQPGVGLVIVDSQKSRARCFDYLQELGIEPQK